MLALVDGPSTGAEAIVTVGAEPLLPPPVVRLSTAPASGAAPQKLADVPSQVACSAPAAGLGTPKSIAGLLVCRLRFGEAYVAFCSVGLATSEPLSAGTFAGSV